MPDLRPRGRRPFTLAGYTAHPRRRHAAPQHESESHPHEVAYDVCADLTQLYQSSQLSGSNAAFVEELYEAYLADPASVPVRWRSYFDTLQSQGAPDIAHGPVLKRIGEMSRQGRRLVLSAAVGEVHSVDQAKQGAVLKLINAYRTRGHLAANLDPLGLTPPESVPDLSPEFFGLGKADLDTEFDASTVHGAQRRKLRDIVGQLQRAYTGSVGAEFMHITEYPHRRWMQERFEAAADGYGYAPQQKKRVLERLTAAEGLERYLHTKYVGQKRFSLEGGDSLIPLIDEMIQRSGSSGAKDVIIGMAHRGRLNVLVNTLGKPPRNLFDAFEGKQEGPVDPAHSGDVKYHLGFSSDVTTPGGTVHLALGFNPSHLEIIDPVVAGSVRARQARRQDAERTQVVPILIHGDSAFAGQGVVMELFQMSQARNYAVGGTIHIVVNNQVGFTTHNPEDTRSTRYCTDVAKIVSAPVFHVNGDDPEAVLFCAQIALDYRQTFKRDVVIDLVCYRRHGHNEADEPAATQPLMYQIIRSRPSTRELYARKLEAEGVIAAGEAKAMSDRYRERLEHGEPVVPELTTPDPEQAHVAVDWSPYLHGKLADRVKSGVPAARIQALSARINTLPPDLKLHSRVAKVYEDRLKMTAGELRMDWGFAETMAYATLLEEGYNLRLSGQDCGRGTFFHRHAVLHDQNTGANHTPLRNLVDYPERVTIIDSLLSEEAVMGFEYGYATADPRTLTIWEGQFGDFCNGAQVVIDQFISSGEAKWGRLCGLVLFLPHGYEGQGPEHSSARLERFLQLCALDNMQVCVPTTPAQMFHMLRRQMLRGTRKPLIVMTPKSMLRHRLSTSTLADLEQGEFQRVIPDALAADPAKVTRVVLCSGKVYYDLVEEHEKRGLDNVAIVRVEQLYPFPRVEVYAELVRFPNARQVIWCQEEPMNQGAWFQIRHHLKASITERHELHYAGRTRSPAPACGSTQTHNKEQAALVNEALSATDLGKQPKHE
ncbi:MAG: 2-oxoglutarate dehydrogenase E1 component [Rhodanobacteraceae bacterium]|nr:2-oxoglutarate dehydrogenase E1 component [Rhodanobacteraceae bacterium]